MKIVLLIPAYKPTIRLIKLINSILFTKNFRAVIINNGNKVEYFDIFNELKKKKFVDIVKVKKNKGKGYGLKKGILYCNKHTKCEKIIFADADGQHTKQDIMKIKNEISRYKKFNAFLIGKRNHTLRTPILNFIGNTLYRLIFNLIHKTKVLDPLSGLRAMNIKEAKKLLNIKSNGFEFEIETIIYFKKSKLPMKNINTSSTYFKNNVSNFNKIIDSLNVLKKTIRFLR
jgi:hypothetical protein